MEQTFPTVVYTHLLHDESHSLTAVCFLIITCFVMGKEWSNFPEEWKGHLFLRWIYEMLLDLHNYWLLFLAWASV